MKLLTQGAYPSMECYEGTGTPSHIVVKNSAADLEKKRDPVLTRALKEIKPVL